MQAELAALIAGLGYATAWDALPQGSAAPRVVLTLISETDRLTLDGREERLTGRVQVDVYAASSKAATTAAEAIRAALSGHAGTLIQHAQQIGGRSMPVDGPVPMYRRSMDFALSWRE